jgi:hypothetical protein
MILLLTMSDGESVVASSDNHPRRALPHQTEQVKLSIQE